MVRILFTQLILFLLPFIGFALWLVIQKKAQTSENWRKGPLAWLAIGGAVLMIGGLALLARIDVNSGDTVYVPAQIIDGKFIPGGYRFAEDTPESTMEGDNVGASGDDTDPAP